MTSDGLQDVREITDVVGDFGPWQIRMLVVIMLFGLPSGWHNLGNNFLAPDLDHWCARPVHYGNMTVDEWKQFAIPLVSTDGDVRYSHCDMYALHGDTVDRNTTLPCYHWEYDNSFFQSTIVDQWDLVCDSSWLVSLSQSVYMFGYLASMLLLSQLSDRYGRRPVMLASLFIFLVPSTFIVLVPSYTLFLVFRFFVSLGRSGFFMTTVVLFWEIIGKEQRSIMNVVRDFAWSIGIVTLPGLAWLVPHWKHLQLTVTLPVVGFLAVWWLVQESPRWLLTHGKMDEAEKVVTTALAINGKKVANVPEILKHLVEIISKEEAARAYKKKHTALDLMKTPNMRKKTLILCYMWCVSSFIFYGLSLNTGNIGGNVFVNTAVSGAAEIPAYVMLYFVIERVSRRRLILIMTSAGGVACILTSVVPSGVLWLAMLGKFCVAASFNIVYLVTGEIHPTEVRNTGMGLSSTFARIGAMCAPFVRELGHYTHHAVPLCLFGALFITSGLLALLLPETLGELLPDTLEQAERFGRKDTNSKDAEKPTVKFTEDCTTHI